MQNQGNWIIGQSIIEYEEIIKKGEIMLPFIVNPNWRIIPMPTIGDIVHLRIEDPFTYLIQAKVESISENGIQVEL
jgi:hypothetical protein